MKGFLRLAISGLPLVAADCPSSPSAVHASCKVSVTANAPCAQVMAEMKARVDGQSTGLWHDPHNNGTYSMLDGAQDTLDFQRVTGNKKYTDKLRFDFKDVGNQCEISGCSASQVFSIADFSTNYCNLRMLYCSSQDGCHPVKFDFTAKETDVKPSLGAGKNPSDCLKVAEVSQDFLAPTQCPPAGFDTVQDFDLEKFIEKRWYIQQQMAVNYLPASQNRCVYAEYQLREKSFWGYDVSVHNHAEEVAAPHKVHDSGKTLCAKVVDKARGKLEVAPCFLPTVAAGPYWVLDYSEQEGYALISGGAPKESAGDAGCRTHLTNYSLNKHSTNYIHSDADDSGSKRKVSSVFKLLKSQGWDVDKVWKDIDDVVCKTLIAVVPALKLEMHIATAGLKKQIHCFQILGFDILLDKKLNPYLLEVNSSPSLRIDYEEENSSGRTELILSTTDLEIKLPVITDSLKLICNDTSADNEEDETISVGCLDQLYPRRAKQFEYLHIFERCLLLFRHFAGLRASATMGASSFRMLARKCMLTDFGFTLASIELLFIAIGRRYWAYDAGRAALNFHGFCDALLTISQRKISITRRSMQELLAFILEHCEYHLRKARSEVVRKPKRILNKRAMLSSRYSFAVDAKVRHESNIRTLLQGSVV